MKTQDLNILFAICITFLLSCSQNIEPKEKRAKIIEQTNYENKAHNFGGWYCPDNLKGFPAVDLNEWSTVPVVDNRFPSKEETQNGNSLIYVDTNEFPNS